jgi:predicted GNAT superfamily acetyltransferase
MSPVFATQSVANPRPLRHIPTMPIRPYTPSDLPALYAINQASTPGVGHEATADGLKRWIDLATCLVATDEGGAPLGFITLIEPGTLAYESANLRWFEAWQAEQGCDLLYVDRIAVSEAARGQGLGQQLYEAAFDIAKGRQWLGAEVNTDPDNPGSHRFHTRLGFARVGEKRYKPDYAVAYYARPV